MALPLKLISPLKLPTADYQEPNKERLCQLKVKYVAKDAQAFTEAGGMHAATHLAIENITDGLAVIAYNSSKRIAAAIHLNCPSQFTPEIMEGLLSLVGKSEYYAANKMHMIGCAMKFKGGDYNNPDAPNHKVYLDIKKAYEVLESHKGQKIELATFDVYQKDKPHGLIFDARTGEMTRLSRLRTTLEQAVTDISSNKSPVYKYVNDEGRSALNRERKEIIEISKIGATPSITPARARAIYEEADSNARSALSPEEYEILVKNRGLNLQEYLEGLRKSLVNTAPSKDQKCR